MEASLLCILMSQQSLYATRRSTSTLESGSPLQQDLSDTLSCVPVPGLDHQKSHIYTEVATTPRSLCTLVNCCMMCSGDPCLLVKTLVKLTRFLVVVDHN